MTITPALPPAPKVALVTGAARRIGREIAISLARDGWRVAVHYRNSRAEADAVVAEIVATGGRAHALEADLGSLDAIRRLVRNCTEVLSAPTCLINNASEFHLDTIGSLRPELWDLHLDINLKAPVFLAQAMVERLPPDAGGNIINIIDQRVWKLTPDFFSYTISKAGLWTATRTLAQALAPRIRVNAIGPGPVLRSIHQTDQEFADEWQSTLLKRGPTAEEIASAVRFILGAPAMTGQMIALDSGQHLT
ncbi:MAG: short chain dehydrogenase [Hyphomicrobium sp.]|nr:short chain dehydrogenase [Hyphomicrobium sp.]PPC83969.1 MAG: short chain dehydrogenase [Hyphomicrobium sp.]